MLQATQGKHVDTETHYSLFLSGQCISSKGRKGNYAKPAKSHILLQLFRFAFFE